MAEDNDKVEKVRAVNAGSTQNVANACKAVDCKLLYLSTDCVFDGQGTEPWEPDCKAYNAECIRSGEAGRLTGYQQDSREILHCPHCLGIWSEWKELHQDDD